MDVGGTGLNGLADDHVDRLHDQGLARHAGQVADLLLRLLDDLDALTLAIAAHDRAHVVALDSAPEVVGLGRQRLDGQARQDPHIVDSVQIEGVRHGDDHGLAVTRNGKQPMPVGKLGGDHAQ